MTSKEKLGHHIKVIVMDTLMDIEDANLSDVYVCGSGKKLTRDANIVERLYFLSYKNCMRPCIIMVFEEKVFSVTKFLNYALIFVSCITIVDWR